MRDITALGSTGVLTIMVLSVIGLPRHDPQGLRRHPGAGLGGGRHAAQPDHEVRLRAPAPRSGAARRRGLHGELSLRPFHDVGGRLPDARRAAGAHAARSRRQGLHPDHRRGSDRAGRHQPRLSRRALADRRAGRLVARRRVGAAVLARRWCGCRGAAMSRARRQIRAREEMLAMSLCTSSAALSCSSASCSPALAQGKSEQLSFPQDYRGKAITVERRAVPAAWHGQGAGPSHPPRQRRRLRPTGSCATRARS